MAAPGCAVGFSGVIFGLIVVDNHLAEGLGRQGRRSVLGLFEVRAALYPWALLLLWQLLVPGASFLGHLCGLLVSGLAMWPGA
jgi:hypothetical protein